VITYMALFEFLRFPTQISITTVSQVQQGLASAERILELIAAESQLDQNAGGYAAPMRGEILFEGVSFAYENQELRTENQQRAEEDQSNASTAEPGFGSQFSVLGSSPSTLQEVSFHVPAGQTVALIGQTGSGKSTLTRLVNRTFDATAGRVLIDGVDVRNWDLDALRSQIGTIEQDIFLFSRSIADNIAFGARSPVERSAIERAARLAEAHEFINAMPQGYDTVIGERGVTLSGGQRQRIAIARAFLSDPRILIIDDSTSALDSATEDRIQRALSGVMEGRTTILITHRLAQIRRADKVLLLRNGRLSAAGGHAELLETSPLYRNIFGV
jgi:ATP-binding cassette subfamily B protein